MGPRALAGALGNGYTESMKKVLCALLSLAFLGATAPLQNALQKELAHLMK